MDSPLVSEVSLWVKCHIYTANYSTTKNNCKALEKIRRGIEMTIENCRNRVCTDSGADEVHTRKPL